MEDKKLLKSDEKQLLNLDELNNVSGGVGSVGTICPKCGQLIVEYIGALTCGCTARNGESNPYNGVDPNNYDPADDDPYGLAPVK